MSLGKRDGVTLPTAAIATFCILFVATVAAGNLLSVTAFGSPVVTFGDGDSMQPMITDWDMLIHNPAPESVSVGDIIRFRSNDDDTIAHRIVDVGCLCLR